MIMMGHALVNPMKSSSSLSKKLFHWLSVFLWIHIPAASSQSLDPSSQPLFKSHYTIQRQVLKNHVIATFYSVKAHFQCMFKCDSRTDCYSMNFYPWTQVCELNDATHLSHPDEFGADASGTFLINLFRSIGWCSNKLCPGIGKRCLLNSDQSSFQCQDYCPIALGMEDRRIPDSAVTASSSVSTSQPPAARLRNTDEWGAGTPQIDEYLQVDLNGVFNVTGIATQGHSELQYWVTSYKIAFRISGAFQFYEENGVAKIFNGNVDSSSVVNNTFTIGFLTRYVRITIQTWSQWPAMRIELYGCPIN